MCDEQEEDLFEDQDQLPDEMKALVQHYSVEIENRDPNEVCREFLAAVDQFGYTFDWGLDGQPFGLQKKSDQN